MKRKIFCVISIILILISSFIPASAEYVSYDSYWSSIYTGNAWPDLWWDSSVAIPRLAGETDEDLSDVHLWMGLETMSNTCNGNWVSDGVFQAMRAGIGDYAGYYVKDYGGGVYTYNPSSSNGVVWNNVTNQYIMGNHSYYTDLGTPHYGVDGRFFTIDGATEEKSEIDNPRSVTYGLFFLGWMFDEYTSTNEDFGTVLCYSLHTNNGAFAVRWTGFNIETNEETKFCYIGICAPQDRTTGIPDASAKLINLGKDAHPFSASNAATDVQLRDQIDQLRDTINQMESDHASEIDQLNLTHSAQIDQLNATHARDLAGAKSESYQAGYNAGMEDSWNEIAIDTSDPSKTLMGFFTVLFRGVRDLIAPILDVSFFGISIRWVVGSVSLVLVIGLMVLLVLKVIHG